MGAATFTKATVAETGGQRPEYVLDNRRVVKGTLTLSNSYASGGDTLDLKTTGLTEITKVLVDTTLLTQLSGFTLALFGTKTAPLLAAYETSGVEVANGTNMSGRPVGVWLVGA